MQKNTAPVKNKLRKPLAAFTVAGIVALLIAGIVLPQVRDELHWSWVSWHNRLSNYQAYLTLWPQGRHAADATRAIETLHWQAAAAENTVQSLIAYMKRYPNGLFLSECKLQINSMIGDDSLYFSAQKAGTKVALRDFLDKYPGHRRETEAQAALEALEWNEFAELKNDLSRNPSISDALKALRSLDTPLHPDLVLPLLEFYVAKLHLTSDESISARNELLGVAIKLFQEMGPTAIPVLISALDDDNSMVVWVAANSLAAHPNGRDAVEPLIRSLNCCGIETFGAVANALGEIGDPRAVDVLIENLDGQYAIQALVNIGEPSIAHLVPLIKEGRGETRALAALALRELSWEPRNQQESIEFFFAELVNVIDYGWSASWEENIKELQNIGEPAIDFLIDELDSSDSDIILTSMILLGKLKEQRAIYQLVSIMNDDDMPLKLRGIAARSLGQVGHRNAIDPLKAHLTNWHINKEVVKALRLLAWEPISDADSVHALIGERNGESLRRDWPRVKSVLLEDARSADYHTIENALFASIGIGKEEMIDHLIQELYENGNEAMAEAYLNSGVEKLRAAAHDWAAKHGYNVVYGQGAAPIGWGKLK